MPFNNMTALEQAGGVRAWLSSASIPGLRAFTSSEIYSRLIWDQAYFSQMQIDLINELRIIYEYGTGKTANPEGGTLVFHGGHVIINDQGSYHREWLKLINKNIKSRGQSLNLPSSHYPGNRRHQEEIQLPVTSQQNWGTVLFGKNNGNTWFQIEAHSGVWGAGLTGASRYAIDVLMHGADFALHKAFKQQVGPCGYSNHTENNNPVMA